MSSTLSSGLKIFNIIEILLSNPKSRQEICRRLKARDVNAFKRTITKYIRTLRKSGFEVRFEGGIFQILKTPFTTTLEEEDFPGFFVVLSLSELLFNNAIKRKVSLLKYKFLNLFENTSAENYKKSTLEDIDFFLTAEIVENIKKINNLIGEKPSIAKITYKNRKYTIVPKSLKYKKNGVFLYCYNKTQKKEQTLKVELISSIRTFGRPKENFLAPHTETVFKITGRLKQNYILREGERAKYTDKEVFVTNIYENKEDLFNRLTKYGAYCEVISSDTDRKKFIKKTKSLLRHYKSM